MPFSSSVGESGSLATRRQSQPPRAIGSVSFNEVHVARCRDIQWTAAARRIRGG